MGEGLKRAFAAARATQPLTPKMIEGLRWFSERGPVAWFDAAAPSRTIRERLRERGYIEQLPARQFEAIKFQITEAGRAALPTPPTGPG